MKKHHKIGLSFLLVIILVVTPSASVLSQPDMGSWVKRRLTYNIGDSRNTAIAVSGNNIHVVWMDDTPGRYDIYYKQSLDNGATWSKSKRLTKNRGDSKAPDIAVSGDNVHVVWFDETPGNAEIYYRHSADNGATWGSDSRLTNNAGASRFAQVAVSGSDIHVVWQDTSKGNREIFYKQSNDSGSTWSGNKRLTSNKGNSCLPTIAVSGSNIHVTWMDETQGNFEIFYKRSSNNGAIWGRKRRLTFNEKWSILPSVAVSGNNVYVVWEDSASGNLEIYYKISSTNGASWGARERLTITTGTSADPAVVASGDEVHVVFFDDTPGNREIYYRWSSDNAATWSSKKRLTKNPGSSSNPAIAVSGGKVYVTWDDDNPGNREIFLKRTP
jgi:hypothetical protein